MCPVESDNVMTVSVFHPVVNFYGVFLRLTYQRVVGHKQNCPLNFGWTVFQHIVKQSDIRMIFYCTKTFLQRIHLNSNLFFVRKIELNSNLNQVYLETIQREKSFRLQFLVFEKLDTNRCSFSRVDYNGIHVFAQ